MAITIELRVERMSILSILRQCMVINASLYFRPECQLCFNYVGLNLIFFINNLIIYFIVP